MDADWYALYVRSCAEGAVEEALRFASISSFWPHSIGKGYRGAEVRRPFFPGYVFAELPDPGEQRHLLLRIPQIVRIVGCGDRPLAIPAVEIQAVRRVAEFAAELKAAAAPARLIDEGQRVTIKHGPLRGITGTAVYAKNATRFIVSVQMLGQAVSAEVDASWLGKAAA